MEKFNSAKELAEYIGVSNSAVSRWILQGVPYEQVGMMRSFKLKDVLNWLEKRSPRHAKMVQNLRAKGRQ